jgi:hypothetical protein
MGKRELLLLVVFVVLGVGVYQVTAPASEPDAPGFSLTRIFQMARAHVQGDQVRRTTERTATLAVPAGVTRLTLRAPRGPVTVEASDRPDIEVRVQLVLGGIDEADVVRQEQAARLDLKASDTEASFALELGDDGRRPRYEMHVRLPKALALRVEGGRGRIEATGIAGLELSDYRGEIRTEALTGPVTGELRDGRAEFGDGATIDLETERVLLRADQAASVTLKAERGTIDLVDPAGPVTIEQDYARMDIRGSGGPITITGDGGTITLREIAHPLKIAASRLTVTAELDKPVETTIDVEDDTVELTLPRDGGLQLEVAVTDGELRVPSSLKPTTTENRQSLTTTIGGGGPLVKVQLERGELRLRTRGAPAT